MLCLCTWKSIVNAAVMASDDKVHSCKHLWNFLHCYLNDSHLASLGARFQAVRSCARGLKNILEADFCVRVR